MDWLSQVVENILRISCFGCQSSCGLQGHGETWLWRKGVHGRHGLEFRQWWSTLCSGIFCKEKKKKMSISHVRLFATPWSVARQAPLSMEFSRQECWSGVAIPFSRGSSPPRDRTWVSHTADYSLLSHQGSAPMPKRSHKKLNWV